MKYDPIMCMMVDDSVKTKDIAPETQRYINTIVSESKARAEKFVRQAEQDYDVPENELKYVYRAYNEKFGYKFHDSASALDKAIRSCDRDPYEYETIKNDIDIAARGKASYITKSSLQSRITRGFQTNRLTKEQKEELWNLVKGVRDEAIRSCDEQIRLIKTISKKNGYAIHIVEGGYGERIVLTFPNESYANPHMWLGSNNSSNIQKAKELLDKFSK